MSKKGAKPASKSEVLANIASKTGLARKQVAGVLDALTDQIGSALGKKGSGLFVIPGLCKIVRVHKPATQGGMKANPFKPGEMMEVKPKPARSVVKVRPLKKLKAMV